MSPDTLKWLLLGVASLSCALNAVLFIYLRRDRMGASMSCGESVQIIQPPDIRSSFDGEDTDRLVDLLPGETISPLPDQRFLSLYRLFDRLALQLSRYCLHRLSACGFSNDEPRAPEPLPRMREPLSPYSKNDTAAGIQQVREGGACCDWIRITWTRTGDQRVPQAKVSVFCQRDLNHSDRVQTQIDHLNATEADAWFEVNLPPERGQRQTARDLHRQTVHDLLCDLDVPHPEPDTLAPERPARIDDAEHRPDDGHAQRDHRDPISSHAGDGNTRRD